ncbi:nuclear factor of activated T-cells 5-like isoform X2 [Anneissia japonica]|uniref:nuclear factor of activated T-cells 5-like isoform X2 n=1 Tax=Anneissia japonica TaxID=1529436 RepID=UPI0014256086|nr:nuclear factor of activated T-cells 5-like isoform X2 [Anneissia japonica]
MDASLLDVSNTCLSYLDSPESLYSSQDGSEKVEENRFFPQDSPANNYPALDTVMGESIMLSNFQDNISLDAFSNSPGTPMSTSTDSTDMSLPNSPSLDLLDDDTVQSIVSMFANEEATSPVSVGNKRPFEVFEKSSNTSSKKICLHSTSSNPPTQKKFDFTTKTTDFKEESKASIVASLAAKVSGSDNLKQRTSLLLPPRLKQKKLPNLNFCPPSKQDNIELSIISQPEKQHRARYLTEGSRGCVKDESQLDFPAVKLTGWLEPVTLQVFVGTDQQKVKPHGYYQACKVYGRTTTPCNEEDVDGTTVIEIAWEPNNDKMEMFIDCVGILKLRNADVEKRIGLARCKRKSTNVRLVFRVNIPQPDGSILTLQTASRSISCTQPQGHPEISKRSCSSCSVKGGEDLFIIGKNFLNKVTEVKIQERHPNGTLIWEADCEVDKSLFHGTHIVCTIPPYKDQEVENDVETVMMVTTGPGKCSELHPFTYTPRPESERKPQTFTSSLTQSLSSSLVYDNEQVLKNISVNSSVNDLTSLVTDKLQMPINQPGSLTTSLSTPSTIQTPFELSLFIASQQYVDQPSLTTQLQMNEVAEVLGIGSSH